MIGVLCLDTGKTMLFAGSDPMKAMNSAIYTLNLAKKDPFAAVKSAGKNGRTLTFDHCGMTYSTLANGIYKG